jgi:hypothetical protein
LPVSNINEPWTPIALWCRAKGLPTPEIQAGSRAVKIGGITHYLGFEPTDQGGAICIHPLDRIKTFEPLTLAPTWPHPRILVLDPGHGGVQAGSRCLTGNRFEKDFTLDWALRLRPLLEAQGWTVHLTRTNDCELSLADRVQGQTGIPYALLDGRLDAAAQTYRTLGQLVRREREGAELAAHTAAILKTVGERVASVPAERRPRTYYARGPRGLETGLAGSINVESIEIMGARNVAGERRGGLATVSLEQVLAWDPEVIVAIDLDFVAIVRRVPAWASVAAVRNGRVHLAPKLPFGWVDFPPSVNRLLGLWWLGKVLYGDLFPEDLATIARDFHARFYHLPITPGQAGQILAGRG